MLTVGHRAARTLLVALGAVALTARAQVSEQAGALPTITVTAQHLNEERARIDTQTGASTYTFSSQELQSAAGRRERADEPGDAAGAERGAGLLRPAAHPRRPQRAAVPSQRRDPSRRHQLLRPDPAAAHDRPVQADHREPAGRVRPAQRRNHRSHHQVRRAAARRRGVPVRRQPRLDRAERQLRRQRGQQQLLPHRRLHRQRPGHRVPRRQQHATARSHQAVPRLRLPRAHLRRQQPPVAHRRHLGRPLPDPEPARPALAGRVRPAAHRRRRVRLPQRRPRREPARDHPFRRAQPAALERPAQRADLAHRALLEPRLLPGPEPRRPAVQRHLAEAFKRDLAYGLQSDAAYRLSDAHTVRAGLFVQADRLTSDTASQVLPTDPLTGRPLNDVPAGIPDDTSATQHIESRLPAGRVALRRGARGELRAALRSLLRVLAAAAS